MGFIRQAMIVVILGTMFLGIAVVFAQIESDHPSERSEKISGSGSIKKDYYIQNNASDSAMVSVDIKNANYYEYTYRLYTDEIRSSADLDLVVERAESIACSGDAKNRNNIPTNITTMIQNGNLTYNNSVVASNLDVQATQNIIAASGDNIDAIGKAGGDNNMAIENIITTTYSERFQSTQEVSVGRDTSTVAHINAITGPLKVSSYIGEGDRGLNTTADVVAGVVSIDQLINPFEAYQDSKGVTGGANFDTLIKNASGDRTHVYTSIGSGNLVNLSQRASRQDTNYTMEYEYMPISYSTGTYDIGYMKGGSDFFSNISLANEIILENCEHMKIIHMANLNEKPLMNTSLNAIAGPLKVASYIVAGDHKLNATADVAAGVVSIDQLMNLTQAHQSSKGVICGAIFDTLTTNADRKKKRAYTEVGSGNLINLSQIVSWIDALYKVEYEYMPVSYQTGTYDMNLNSSKTEGI
jgi:hypothetical protein